MFRWFGFEPKLRFEPFENWKVRHSPEDAQLAWEHISRQLVHVHRQGTSAPRLQATLLKLGCSTGGGFRFDR